MEDVSSLEAHGQARVPADQVPRKRTGQHADIAAERPEHWHVVALTAKGVIRIGPFIGRDGFQLRAQLRKVVLLDMLAECVDLAHQSACDVLPGATELLAFLETVCNEA